VSEQETGLVITEISSEKESRKRKQSFFDIVCLFLFSILLSIFYKLFSTE